MTRPRLAFIVESGTDFRLVEGLSERFELSLLLRRIPGGVEVSQPLAAPPSDLEVGPPGRVAFARRVSAWLRERRRALDLVLAQGHAAAALAAQSTCARLGLPATLLVCSPTAAYYRCRRSNPHPEAPFRWSELAGLLALTRANAALCAHAVALSRHLAQVLAGHGFRCPLDVIPVYGVDPAVFQPARLDRLALRTQLGLPAGELVFFSSRVAPEKDVLTLLAALQRLVDQGRDIRLLHASGGWRRLAELAGIHGLAARTIARDALHPTRELPAFLQASDLVVQASREEGLGFSPLEALACLRPVVASAVGGLRETIVDGVTGWTAPPARPDLLARAIAAALDDPDEADRRTMRGRELVLRDYASGPVFDRLAACLIARLHAGSVAEARVRA